MVRARRSIVLFLGAAALVLAPAAADLAAAGAGRAPEPFKYTYRITDLTVTAEYKSFGSTAKTTLRLEGPSKMRWLSYFGPKPRAHATTVSTAVLYLAGEATYSSPEPSCASKLTYRSSRSHPVRAVLVADTFNSLRIRVQLVKFPLARAIPGQDSGAPYASNRCGEAQVRWYDDANAVLPGSVMTKPSFTVTAVRRSTFEDSESIDWTLEMTVKRLRYHRIDCATEPGC